MSIDSADKCAGFERYSLIFQPKIEIFQIFTGKIEIPSTPLVTSSVLLTLLTDIILSQAPDSEDAETKEIFENNLKDVMNIIGTIVKGLDVNVK